MRRDFDSMMDSNFSRLGYGVLAVGGQSVLTLFYVQLKIGTGIGEQMLSREYYYPGTQLPIEHFRTFYFGHPVFHIHNMFVTLSFKSSSRR